ncbi:MAG: FAD-dependent oxidoreductase [Candidatus Kapabacteria bacterium]|nr:FAD-dependent oxidoreductase [Candidatus Kapabacteria bacterium]
MAKRVAVLGGGVAGMSVAHELIERGIVVDVYDRHHLYVGGKARSVEVHETNQIHSGKYLPGEHGFRFFPGFYRHVTDTMSRIPFRRVDGSMGTVLENLTPTNRVLVARTGRQSLTAIVNFPSSLDDLRVLFSDLTADTGLTDEEMRFFTERVWQLMTSCRERRADEYERISWWDFLQADRFSDSYRALLVQGLTRTLVAANAHSASTKTGGNIFLQLIFNMTSPGVHTDRVLNGPTNDVWLAPWREYLEQRGVQFHLGHTVEQLMVGNGKLSSVTVRDNSGELHDVQADMYVLAVPVERAARLITKDLIALDSNLEGIVRLAPSVAWMNGVQYYLNVDRPIVHGHTIYSDSPWALTSISQLQFWPGYDIEERGNGRVRSILSVDVSGWDSPGSNGKIARECSHEEIRVEVWKQLCDALNVDGNVVLSDEMIEFWHIDGDIKAEPHDREMNEEPLLVNTVRSWDNRPEAYTAIGNLFLASDYVRTNTDLATMEAANEAARRAVNAILESVGSSDMRCEVWDVHEPITLAALRAIDKRRYDMGLPWREPMHWLVEAGLSILQFIRHRFGRATSQRAASDAHISPRGLP